MQFAGAEYSIEESFSDAIFHVSAILTVTLITLSTAIEVFSIDEGF